jgi:hypothetical protein
MHACDPGSLDYIEGPIDHHFKRAPGILGALRDTQGSLVKDEVDPAHRR